MGARSLPPVSAKVIADIESFVADFKRAENVTKRTTAVIDKELTDLANKTAKKFQLADVGKDILKGAGLFGGFQIAETISEKFVEHFREAAQHAQNIEQSIARQVDYTKQLIALRQTDSERLDTLRHEREQLEAQINALKDPKSRTFTTFTPRGEKQTLVADLTKAQTDRINELTEALGKLGLEIERLEGPQRLGAVNNALREYFLEIDKQIAATKSVDERYEELGKTIQNYSKTVLLPALKAEQDNRTAHLEQAAALGELVQKYKDVADPMAEYQRQLEAINKLESENRLTPEEATAARKAAADKQFGGAPNRSGVSIEDDDLSNLDAYAEKTAHLTSAARDLGFAFSSAFEDAVIGGEKLGDVLRGLTQDLLRMALRMSVTNPLINSVFGLTGADALPSFFGGARAGGGPVRGGSAYLVGEEGPELFVPNGGGSIVPNHAMAGGGDTFNFSYNFASGVTRQEVAGLIPQLVESSKRAVLDAVKRGGGYRRAFA